MRSFRLREEGCPRRSTIRSALQIEGFALVIVTSTVPVDTDLGADGNQTSAINLIATTPEAKVGCRADFGRNQSRATTRVGKHAARNTQGGGRGSFSRGWEQ